MPYAHVREMVVERDGELHIAGLPLRPGERVDVFVIPRTDRGTAGGPRYPLHGQPIQYDNPFGPAADPDEWEANR